MVYFKGGDLDLLTTEEKNLLIKIVSTIGRLPSVKRKSEKLT